jgi:hypothetical protein
MRGDRFARMRARISGSPFFFSHRTGCLYLSPQKLKLSLWVAAITSLLIFSSLYSGCAENPGNPTTPATSPTPTVGVPTTTTVPQASNITPADSSRILDLLSLLSEEFHRADDYPDVNTQIEDGYLIAGEGWSQGEVFVSANPFQFVRAYLNIAEGPDVRSALDTLFTCEERFNDFLRRSLENQISDCSAVPDVINSSVKTDILGERALYGQATRENIYHDIGFDALFFRQGNVYVFLCSFYTYPRVPYLPDIGAEVLRRITAGTP